MSIKDTKKLWKEEGIVLANVVMGFYDLEKKGRNYFGQAIKAVVAGGINTLDKFEVMVDKANKAACETEMNNQLQIATTEEEVKSIQITFIHQKTTKQHTEGTFKTSVLPNSWRTAVSVIGSAISLKIPLIVKGEDGEYYPQAKSALDKLIKAASEPATNTGATTESGGEVGDEQITLKKDTRPIDKLEVVVKAMTHILAEIEDPEEFDMAKKMVSTVWDLSPMKIAAEA
jgi:hypothetical protein